MIPVPRGRFIPGSHLPLFLLLLATTVRMEADPRAGLAKETAAALEAGVLARAEAGARTSITTLLRGLGYRDVVVESVTTEH